MEFLARSRPLLLGAALLGAAPLYAHHSFSTHYILDQPLELTGTVTSVQLRNPHSFIMMDVTNEAGEVEQWEVEIHSVPLMRRFGVTNGTIMPGDVLHIEGPSPRADKLVTFGNKITLPDGTQLELLGNPRESIGQRVTASLTEKFGTVESAGGALLERLAGRWSSSNDFERPDERPEDTPMPLTKAGWTARANYDARVTPAGNCIPPNVPSILYVPYLLEFRTDSEQQVIHHEYFDVTRPYEIGGTEAGPEGFGVRTARIEGEALIIESTGFEDHPAGLATDFDYNGQNRNIPGSDQKTYVERYTLQDNNQLLVLNYTVTDPVYLTEAYSHELHWRRVSPEVELFTMGCDRAIALRSTLNAGAPETLPNQVDPGR